MIDLNSLPNQARSLRSPREIAKMRRAGLVVWQAHQAAYRLIRPGVPTWELNAAIRETFQQYQAHPLFLNYPGKVPFPAESCISLNEELVHGIPGPRKLKEGDIVTIDTGCRLSGWCGDAAITHAIGKIPAATRRLLEATHAALNLAVELMAVKSRWSEVACEMEALVVDAGFCVVDEMVGHGIGQNLHEPPEVPNFYDVQRTAKHDFELRPGVVIAVEPMVNIGTKKLICLADHWTQVSANKKPTAHFEHTIAMTADGPKRLTAAPVGEELEWVPIEFRDPSQWVVW